MEQIRTKPANKKYRANYDRIFKKADCPRGKTVTGSSKGEPSDSFQKVYVTNDPHFGG